MNYEDVKAFQSSQKEIVAMIGAFLVPLKEFSESLGAESEYMAGIRRIQPIVSGFVSSLGVLNQFCENHHYQTYAAEVRRPATRIFSLLGNQTLPSKSIEVEQFKNQLDIHIEGISEVMIAVAQIIAPTIDINIRASNSFSAYCFLSSVMDSISSTIVIVDPYVDQSIFYRYLYRLPIATNIKIVTDGGNLTGQRLASFESVEVLFSSEYQNYQRVLLSNLHDRYLITETNAYSLGGSIKDAAKNADYSITQISEEQYNEISRIYA